MVAPRRLDTLGALPLVEVAGVTAAIAAAVSRVHQAGRVQGALNARDITVDAAGIPSLPDPASPDPASPGPARGGPASGEGTPEDDVAAIGAILSSFLRAGAPGDPWHALLGRVRGRHDDTLRWTLTRLAAASCDPRPERRPTAAALAKELAAVAGARLPARNPERGPRPHRGSRAHAIASARPRSTRVLVGLGTTLLVAAALFGVSTWGPPARAGSAAVGHGASRRTAADDRAAVRAPAATEESSTTAPPPTSTEVASRLWPPDTATMRACPAAAAKAEAIGIDLDGDGCADVAAIDGTTVSAGRVRFQVGTDGDMLTLGDWRCDGHRTIALLRPVSGAVYAFDGWAPDGGVLSGRLIGRVPGATAITASEPCGRAEVSVAEGPPVVLRTEAGS